VEEVDVGTSHSCGDCVGEGLKSRFSPKLVNSAPSKDWKLGRSGIDGGAGGSG